MAGLLDIGPLTDIVTVNGTQITVRGINVSDLFHLVGRFPEVRNLLSGENVSIERVLQIGGEVVPATIAAACGHVGDSAYEEKAAGLSLDAQADFIGKIWPLTFPNGVGPFAKKLEALGGVLAAGPKPIKVRAVKSPAPSPS